ncbi:dipeptidase PepE [Corallincola luteus]|uniref:Dipeptidase PepE n=1 Tax=Corallincola luteus TaxID=1775177 RepID=A0ABY2AK09_9GAMM|nr:dipeptidase PepE [Corallincola luteus]TCI03196.1 dipeptidase PepE [Corallincola luteus]
MKKLLLLSSSRYRDNAYLAQPLAMIRDFLPSGIRKAVFIPYAGVTISYSVYHRMVAEALQPLNLDITNITDMQDPIKAVQAAELILVGGGNTFQLLASLYDQKLIDAIQSKVDAGTPYIGWSAGSNMAGPTICTTNDMPIVCPPSFNALNLVPYQINPHFTDATLPGHNGESRSQRLAEYLTVAQGQRVIALPEGCCIKVEGEQHTYHGDTDGKVLRYQVDAVTLKDGDDVLNA